MQLTRGVHPNEFWISLKEENGNEKQLALHPRMVVNLETQHCKNKVLNTKAMTKFISVICNTARHLRLDHICNACDPLRHLSSLKMNSG